MARENRWSTRNYDLAKGTVLLVLLLLLVIALIGSQNVAQNQQEPSPVGAAPVWNPPQTAADGSVSLSGRAEPGSTVELWAGEVKLAAVPVDADGNWSYAGQLDQGEHQIVARTVSVDGQVLNASKAVVVRIGEPTPPPAVIIARINPPKVEPDGSVSLSGSAAAGSTVELWAGAIKLAAVPVGTDGGWSYAGQLDPGEYAIVARTVSVDGQVLNESQAVVLRIGGTTPQAGITIAQIESRTVEPDGGVSLSGSAEPGSTVELWAGEIKLAAVPVDTDGSWSYAGQLDPGEYAVVARTISVDGQVLNESKAVAVSVPAAGAAAVTASEPQIDASGGVILSGTGEPGSTLDILDNGVVVASAVVGEDGTWTVRYAAFTGEHTLAVQVQGQAGEGSTAASVTVTVPAAAGGQSYVVKSGDWLIKLARRYYGDSRRWIDIYEATNAKAAHDPSYHRIGDPGYLRPGWKLWIPEP